MTVLFATYYSSSFLSTVIFCFRLTARSNSAWISALGGASHLLTR